jgi:hypothetical protein
VVQESNSNLMDDFTQSDSKSSGVKLVFLDEADES